MSGCAWVTLSTNDTYCLGALVLAHSLKQVCTQHQLAIIITPQVSPAMREQLSKVFNVIQMVDVLDSNDATNLALLQRPDLGVTFTKIHCWTLTQFSKCVFLDADTLVMQNCDELFERDELSAAPDPGWPDCFNSGVFVFVPSLDTYQQLIQFVSTHGSFDGGDQGLLNMYFNDWPTNDIRKHLSFLYNMCSTSTYTYLPALKYYGANIKIVHFIGANKPWLMGPASAGMSAFTQAWWDGFQSNVAQSLSKNMSGLAGALGSKEKSAVEEQWRKQNWEQGNIDFTGKDSFEHIWKKIMDAVNKPKAEAPKKPEDKPILKEIASQAIPEKEKADIPEALNKSEKLDSPIVEAAPLPIMAPSMEAPAPLAIASTPPPLPKVAPTTESIQLATGIPPVETPSKDTPIPAQPIPLAPPTLEAAPLPLVATAQLPELPKDTSSELSLEQALESGDLPKIEDILKGLELQLAESLKEPLPGLPKEDKPVETKKTEESQLQAIISETLAAISDVPNIDASLPEIPKDIQFTPKVEAPNTPKSDSPVKSDAPSPLKADAPGSPKLDDPASPKADAPPKPDTPVPPKADSSTPPKPDAPVSLIAHAPVPPKCDVPISPVAEASVPVKDDTPASPKTDAPASPKTDAPASPKTDAPASPKTDAPASPKTDAPASPKTDAPASPKADAPASPKADAPALLKTDVPAQPKFDSPAPPKSEAQAPPIVDAPVLPKGDAPAPLKSEAQAPAKVDASVKGDAPAPLKSEAQASPKGDAPVPPKGDAPALPKSEAQAPTKVDAPVSPKAEEPKIESPKVEESKNEVPKDAPLVEPPKSKEVKSEEHKTDAPKSSEAKESSQTQVSTEVAPPAPMMGDGKKQKTPPKEQNQKGQKQQAPQPPPKNGKQKKGQQQTELTSAHPLAEPEAPKLDTPKPETPKADAAAPITPPASPSGPLKSETQPGTPTVTAPTPPVTPTDASKTVDPLSQATPTSSGAEVPVPPKRKGKEAPKQPQKQSSNGGKGKAKK